MEAVVYYVYNGAAGSLAAVGCVHPFAQSSHIIILFIFSWAVARNPLKDVR